MPIHKPKNERPIPLLWAWVSYDEDGNEGIVAAPMPGLGMQPLVTGSERNIGFMNTLARKVADMTGSTIRRVRFVATEAEEVFKPTGKERTTQ